MASGIIPRQFDLDQLNVFIKKAVSGTTFDITVPAGYRALMFTVDSGQTICGMWYLWSTAQAAAGSKTISSASGFSLSGSTGKFTVTKTNNTTPMMIFFEIAGRASI